MKERKKEDIMKTSECIPQKMSKLMFASLALAGAIGSIIIGVTLLPIFGFIASIPLFVLAIYTLRLHLNDQCEIDFTAK
jgi:hypothetical protein